MEARRDVMVIVTVVVGLALVLLLIPRLLAGSAIDEAALVVDEDEVPQGVSAWEVDGRRVFVIREGDSVGAFLGYTTHLEDEPIWWCPTRAAFISPFHGEAYDTAGRILGGPQSRALDALPVQQHGPDIVVAPRPVVTGAPADDPSARSDLPWTDYVSCPSPLK